jgi:hypothetical protein
VTHGRVDILLFGLMNELAKRQPNPLLEAAVEHCAPKIQETLENIAGPGTEIGRRTNGDEALFEGDKCAGVFLDR